MPDKSATRAGSWPSSPNGPGHDGRLLGGPGGERQQDIAEQDQCKNRRCWIEDV